MLNLCLKVVTVRGFRIILPLLLFVKPRHSVKKQGKLFFSYTCPMFIPTGPPTVTELYIK